MSDELMFSSVFLVHKLIYSISFGNMHSSCGWQQGLGDWIFLFVTNHIQSTVASRGNSLCDKQLNTVLLWGGHDNETSPLWWEVSSLCFSLGFSSFYFPLHHMNHGPSNDTKQAHVTCIKCAWRLCRWAFKMSHSLPFSSYMGAADFIVFVM